MARKTSEAWKRPFRLWDTHTQKDLPRRYFAHEQNAQNAALLEARWAKVGATIQVYDCHNAAVLGEYKRTVNSVEFTK